MNAYDRYVYDKLLYLQKILKEGDYPDCKGICGFIRMFSDRLGQFNKDGIEEAIGTMKDIMTEWPDASNSWEYPIPGYDSLDSDEAEKLFEYMDTNEHWCDTEYANMRKQLLEFTINKYVEIFANESASN